MTIERQDLGTVPLVKGGSTDMALLAEVGGSVVRVKAEDIAPYKEDDVSYGVEKDAAVSSDVCTRVGNMAMHKTLPVHSLMRGCLLDDNGEVKKYLSERDWTAEDRTGASGQVMVEIPQHWEKFMKNGTKREVRFSLYPLPGYMMVPKMYVSAYQATLDRTGNKLCSVANKTAQYRGGNNNASYDGTDHTMLGVPASDISLTNFRDYARKRKTGSTEWNCMTYLAQQTLYWLFVVEYATLNTQNAYNAELTKEGYRQGGLDNGVATLDGTKWMVFNGQNPFIPCGYTDDLGNRTGIKSYQMPASYDASKPTVSVPRYRGIENPFGHIFQWTDGILVEVNPDSGNKLSRCFVTHDPSKFSSSSFSSYTFMGNLARSEGYIKEVIFDGGCIMPLLTGGGNTSYHCDYYYCSLPTGATAELRGVRFGGSSNASAYNGLVFSNVNIAPSAASANIGSRLCFHPKIA